MLSGQAQWGAGSPALGLQAAGQPGSRVSGLSVVPPWGSEAPLGWAAGVGEGRGLPLGRES